MTSSRPAPSRSTARPPRWCRGGRAAVGPLLVLTALADGCGSDKALPLADAATVTVGLDANTATDASGIDADTATDASGIDADTAAAIDAGAATDAGGIDAGTAVPVIAAAGRDRSGRRLKVRYWEAGGARARTQLYDSELGVPCTFLTAADGERRCLPNQLTLPTGTDYADMGCRMPAIKLPRPACERPVFVTIWMGVACNELRYRVFKVGPTTADGGTYPGLGANRCSDRSYPVLPGTEAHLLGEEVPPAAFVKATRGQPAGAAVAPALTEAEDGTVIDGALWDGGGQTYCNATVLEDGKTHCVPEDVPPPSLFAALFTDSACTTPAVVGWPASCNVHRLASRSGAACPASATLVAWGPAVSAVFLRDAAGCRQAGVGSTDERQYLLPGAAVPAADLPLLEERRTGLGGRLEERVLTTPGGEQVLAGLWDTAAGEACTPRTFAAVTRCAPSAAVPVALFADAACTLGVVRAPRDACKPSLAFRSDGYACPVTTHYFKLGAEHAGPFFQPVTAVASTGTKMECRPFQVTDTAAVAYHQVGEPIAEDTLPELRLVEAP